MKGLEIQKGSEREGKIAEKELECRQGWRPSRWKKTI